MHLLDERALRRKVPSPGLIESLGHHLCLGVERRRGSDIGRSTLPELGEVCQRLRPLNGSGGKGAVAERVQTPFDSAAEQTLKAAKAMNRPEMDWFLENCMEPFRLNLDQL